MGLFNFGKKKPVKRVGGYTDGGNHKVDVFDGPDGVVEIKRCNTKDRLPTGLQYCPDCHTLCDHKPEGYYECPICKYSITDEEADEGYGYPSVEATYEDDFNDEYGSTYRDDEDWE